MLVVGIIKRMLVLMLDFFVSVSMRVFVLRHPQSCTV